MKISRVAKSIIVPEFLYHATYKPLLDSIVKNGLGNTHVHYWEDSKPFVVYLATDADCAESYAEANDNVDDEYLDQIVILKIDTKDLDYDKLFIDENVIDNDGSTFEYHGIIRKFMIMNAQ